MAFNRRLSIAVVVPVLTLLLVPVSSVNAATLADLVTNGTDLYSQDGSVRFHDFAYVPTVGAPAASDILVNPDPANPQGFKVTGNNGESFLAEDGESFSVYIGCEASLIDQVIGDYIQADLRDFVSDTSGSEGTSGSTAAVNVKIDSLDNVIAPDLLAVMNSVIGTDVLSDSDSLSGFGNDVSVLAGVSVYSIPDVTGAKAEVSEFAVNLSNIVPEPATGMVLLCLAGLVARRRR